MMLQYPVKVNKLTYKYSKSVLEWFCPLVYLIYGKQFFFFESSAARGSAAREVVLHHDSAAPNKSKVVLHQDSAARRTSTYFS